MGKSIEAQRINFIVDKIRVEVIRCQIERLPFPNLPRKLGVTTGRKVYFNATRPFIDICICFFRILTSGTISPLKELNFTFINDFGYFLRAKKQCRINTV